MSLVEIKESRPIQQKHLFQQYSILSDSTVSFNVFCGFPVKEARFNFAYEMISPDNNIMIVVSSDLVNGETVGVLNKFSQIDGNIDWVIRQDLSETTVFSHIFKDPIMVPNSITLTFRNLTNATITTGTVLAHLELLSA